MVWLSECDEGAAVVFEGQESVSGVAQPTVSSNNCPREHVFGHLRQSVVGDDAEDVA